MVENVVQPFFKSIMLAIIADLKNRKLLLNYTKIGLDVSIYETDLNIVVLQLAGIRNDEKYHEIKEWYNEQVDRVENIDIRNSQKVIALAGEIITGLMEKRTKH